VSVRLVPLAREHLPGVEGLLDDPEVLRFTRIPDEAPPDFTETWFGLYEQGRLDGTREAFAAVGNEGEFLGLALAPRIEREAETAELGYIVAPAARGRGVATAALRLLTDWAFAELGAVRLELLIGSANEPSKRVAERNGYRREGLFRSLYVKPGLRDDVEIWSRLASD
jgi:RimJ/RimL family protein N-acetyltransferase